MEKKRCAWCCDGGLNQHYHDHEWGIPLYDDQKQFEFLMMEVMQCGLTWTLMLKKREIFHQCFCGFDYRVIAAFTDADVTRIMNTEGMIRSERKIRAVIHTQIAFSKSRESGAVLHAISGISQTAKHIFIPSITTDSGKRKMNYPTASAQI